jgi:hypothetical protein
VSKPIVTLPTEVTVYFAPSMKNIIPIIFFMYEKRCREYSHIENTGSQNVNFSLVVYRGS